jgi:hypothetical protein
LYSSSRKGLWKFNVPSVYKFLAIYIRMQALQQRPTESDKNRRSQTGSYKQAVAYFHDRMPDHLPPGNHLVELLHSKLLISPKDEALLTENYLSKVVSLGQWVAGDEKLFKWTGESSWLRMCPNKDDYIGLWFYMLCGRLSSGKSFLLYTKSHTVETVLGGTVYCSQVMSDWGDIVTTKSTEQKTFLVADSYYLDHAGYEILTEKKVPFVCAIQECRFAALAKKARTKSRHEGDTALLYNDDSHDMFVTHWYADAKKGRKFVMSNAYTRSAGTTRKGYVPGCDDFTLTFNSCDHFNRDMHDKTWPHRCATAPRQLHNYHFTCMLLNTMNVWMWLTNKSENSVSFKDFGLDLADELYEYSVML